MLLRHLPQNVAMSAHKAFRRCKRRQAQAKLNKPVTDETGGELSEVMSENLIHHALWSEILHLMGHEYKRLTHFFLATLFGGRDLTREPGPIFSCKTQRFDHT